LAWLGGQAKLLARGDIDAHRRIEAADGVAIDVWVIRARNVPRERPRGTVLFAHGLWDSKARMYRPGQRLADRGFDVVLPDLRSHGRSGGTCSTFGALEAGDLKSVMDALADEGLIHGQIHVVGFSMGGGIAVQYAAADPRCRGVLALAPVASARRIMKRMLLVRAPLAGKAEIDATIDRAGELGGFDIDAASAVACADRLRCPLIVAHGRCDLTVPPSHGRDIFEAAQVPKKLILVPFVGHNSLLFGRTGWIADQIDWLDGR
jgi:hypothetical protein